MFQKMELLPNESVVSMVEFAGTLYIATTQRIFKKLDNDELVPLQLITIKAGEAMTAGEDTKGTTGQREIS